MAFPLTQEQRQVVEHRGSELLVSAAAGSGKTRVLVERLLDRVVREGVDIDRFLVITFTRAAASELRERVAREISDRLAEDPGNAGLRRQATLVYKASISTIHSLCGDLLREFGHTMDLDPDYRLLDEGEAQLLQSSVLEDVMERAYETVVPGDDFSQLLDQFSAGRDDTRLMEIVSDLYGHLQAHPAPMEWLAEMESLWDLGPGALPEDTFWGRQVLRNTAETAAFWAEQLNRAKELCTGNEGLSYNYLPSLADGANLFTLLEEAAGKGWDAVRELGELSFLTAGRKKMDQTLVEVEQVKQIRAEAKKTLEKLMERFSQSGAETVADLRKVHPAVRGLFALVREFDRAFQKEKQRKNVLDFNDLEHYVVKLLENEEVAQALSERFVEVMVDEYQDTNAVQNAIFDVLSHGGERLFQVGDVKQSIYRFRMADPTIFLGKYASFGEKAGEKRRMTLSANFRSRPQVLGAVNDLFRAILSVQLGELEYSADQALNPGGSFPEGENPRWNTELNVLLAPKEEEEDEDKVPKDLQEARFVAKRLKQLMTSGFRVSEGDGLRPVRPGDMAVLLRSPGAQKQYYARAFREVGLPWQSEGSGNLLETLEVQVALALLQVVDNPRQDVPLIAALRSPAYRMSADRLAELRANSPDTDFYTALRAGAQRGETDCCTFLQELEPLRLAATDRPTHELIWLLYGKTDLVGIFSALDGGAERRGNLMLLYEYARTFEQTGHKGLYRFLRHLRRLQERGQELPGVVSGRGESAVTLLSIHRSKGLEFPVVVVAGLNRRFNRTDMYAPLLFHPELGVGPMRLNSERHLTYPTLARSAIAQRLDREMLAEEMRLLYVAMTRARDKLILCCAMPDGEKKLPALAPWATDPVLPERLAGCATAGEWVLLHALSRPEALALRKVAGGVVPTLKALESTWDIHLYQQDREERRWVPAAGETAASELPEGITAHYGWQYGYPVATVTPSKLTATQLKGRNLDAEAAQTAPTERKAPTFRRPRFLQEDNGLTGTERGSAVHLAMQYFDFSQSGSREAVKAELDRMVAQNFLTEQQRECVSEETILAFFRSELGRELLAAKRLEREFKFSLLTEAEAEPGEKILFQGVVDCWFENEDGSLTVVDFKTDRKPQPELYRAQVTSYARALERITGKPVRRQLLYFFADGSIHAFF